MISHRLPVSIIIIFIAGSVTIILYNTGFLKDRNSGVTVKNQTGKPDIESWKSSGKIDNKFVYPANNLRDPFQKLVTPIHKSPDISDMHEVSIILRGIIWKPKEPAAIITDSVNKSHIVKAGDTINNTYIIAVHQKSVIIEINGKRQELSLWPERF